MIIPFFKGIALRLKKRLYHIEKMKKKFTFYTGPIKKQSTSQKKILDVQKIIFDYRVNNGKM